MEQVAEILPRGRQGPIFPAQLISWLLVIEQATSGARPSAATVLT